MNFLQKIKSSAGKVTDRAQNVVEIGRLNTQINNIEREVELYYQKMGEVFYEGYRHKDMSKAQKEMMELAKTCDLLIEERDEIRSQIAELRNERLCVQCGRVVAEDAMFCQYCGHKLEPRPKVRTTVHAAVDEDKEMGEDQHNQNDYSTLYESSDFHQDSRNVSEDEAELEIGEVDDRKREQLDREQMRQQELDQRIRTWREKGETLEPKPEQRIETGIPTVPCQICSATLVKGTKWCPHCNNEQI